VVSGVGVGVLEWQWGFIVPRDGFGNWKTLGEGICYSTSPYLSRLGIPTSVSGL